MRRPAIRSTAHKPILSYSILPILSYARATTTTHNPRKVNWHHILSTTFVNLRPAQDSFQHHIESGAGIGNNRSIYQYFKLLQIKQINIFYLEKLIKMIVWLYIIIISCWLRWILDLSPIFQTFICQWNDIAHTQKCCWKMIIRPLFPIIYCSSYFNFAGFECWPDLTLIL